MAAEQRGVLCGGRDHHCGGHAGLFLTLRASSCFILASRGRSMDFSKSAISLSDRSVRQEKVLPSYLVSLWILGLFLS